MLTGCRIVVRCIDAIGPGRTNSTAKVKLTVTIVLVIRVLPVPVLPVANHLADEASAIAGAVDASPQTDADA